MTAEVRVRRPPCLCAARSYSGQKIGERAWVIGAARRSVAGVFEDEATPSRRRQRIDLSGGCPLVPACVGECGGGSTSSGEGRVCALVGVPKPWFPCAVKGACQRWWAVAVHIRHGREKCQWRNGRRRCTIAL